MLRGLYSTALAAADAYATAIERVEEQDVASLLRKLQSEHLRFANELKKRVARLDAEPEARTGLTEAGGRAFAMLHAAGSLPDVLAGMRAGEEQGVVLCRETLEHADLSGKSKALIEAYKQTHLGAIRDLSEQIALHGATVQNSVQYYVPGWLRYPSPGFWVAQGVLLLLGYLWGRRGTNAGANK